jgi:ATP phosphoribosyltransferase
VAELDFGQCRLSFGVPASLQYSGIETLRGKRIATSYPRTVEAFLVRSGIDAKVVEFSGAVEIAPSLGKADLICDLVSSGATMKAHDLVEAETILQSRAAIIRTPAELHGEKLDWVERLLKRIAGVLQVKESKYIMLHAPRSALKQITALLPGAESPTIIPLEGRPDKVAVHAVCRENVFWETLEELQKVGASSMLVLPVEKMFA